MNRISFIVGACAAGAAPSPSASPAGRKAHVHGANGVVTIPEHRPLEMTMQVLDGPDLRLSDYAGKVVFLNIFATWCGPCRDEQPALSAFARAHPEDTAVIGLNYREEDNLVRTYRSQYSVGYPIAMDRQGRILRGIYAGGRMAFPMTMVVAPDRTLFCAWRGDKSREWFEREREAALTQPAES